MDIVIHSMGIPFNGETISKKSLGGSETAAYYLARELVRHGHRVKLFTNCRDEGHWDGVHYLWAGDAQQIAPLGERWHFYAENTPHDVTIVQRHPQAFLRSTAGKVRIWNLHDLAQFHLAPAVQAMAHSIDIVTTVSEWHKQQVAHVYGLNPERIRVVRNAVDPALYRGEITDLPGDFVAHEGCYRMLYQSRPERGLEHLLRPGGIMDRLLAAKSNAHLFVCSYDHVHPSMAEFYAALDKRADELPNVTRLGCLTKSVLAQVQRSCDLLCYPTEFKEVSCITAMEAMHAELPMLTSKHAALTETCKKGGTVLLPLKDGHADEDAFFHEIQALERSEKRREVMRLIQRGAARDCTWERAGAQLEDAMQEQFVRCPVTTMVRRMIDLSDIRAAKDLVEDRRTRGTLPRNAIMDACVKELSEKYAFADSTQAFHDHYTKWQDENYYADETRDFREDVTSSSRFRGVFGEIRKIIEEREAPPDKPLRVLDYGCAHGHYLVPLALAFPDCQFVGVDISKAAIEKCTGWIADAKLGNARAEVGTLPYMGNDEPPLPFDIIIAAEVVEHQPDPVEFLNALMVHLDPQGTMLITTPTGPWERAQYRQNDFREHLHHFERQDWYDMAGHLRDFGMITAPASHSPFGEALGSFIVTFGRGEIRPINYRRKISNFTDRETISACMIVKDGAEAVTRAMQSVIEVVDEFIVAIDPATTDNTADVVSEFALRYPYVPVTILHGIEAIKEGFDAARNLTIESACGDWIYWMDCDEKLVHANTIPMLARSNLLNAFGIPQIHYSADPPQVLTTDFPSRLFRNGLGVRFYGLVHEHPEVETGSAIPFATIHAHARVVHDGYITEDVRRRRFERNLPLLMRDLDRHPNRVLNKFLYLRDLAQGVAFERQEGIVRPEQAQMAAMGINIFEQLLGTDHLRMIVDSVPFYSICVEVVGGGFEAATRIAASKLNGGASLAAAPEIKGRFLNEAHWMKLVEKLAKETVKHYDSDYY